VSVLLHDADFSDTAFCTFWLPPNTPLNDYRLEYTLTRDWADVALAFYASTPAETGWIVIDDVRLYHFDVDVPPPQTRCFDPLVP
jgi:hypothetical protein